MNWQRQITVMFFAQLIIIAALEMSDPYWPLIITQLHHFTPKQIQYWSASIYIAPFITTIITTPLWTRLGAQIGYKKMILRAGYALALTQLLLVFTTDPVLILMIRLLQGALAGFTAAAQAWSVTIAPSNEHSYVIGRLQAATALGAIIGPICGGFIAHYYGYVSIFLSAGLICLFTITLLAKYLQETAKQFALEKDHQVRLNTILRSALFPFLLLICFMQAARWMSTPFFALYVIERLSGNNLTVGLLYSSIALSISFTTPFYGRLLDCNHQQTAFTRNLLITTLLLAGLTQLGYALIKNFYMALLLSLLWGICLGGIAVILFSLLIKNTDSTNKGYVIGLGNSAVKLGNLIGIALGAIIKAETNFTESFMIIGLFYILIGCYVGYLKLGKRAIHGAL